MPVHRSVRMLPQLVWHRQQWGILRPYITLNEGSGSVQAEELKSAGVFCAGFVDSNILTNDEHFDVIVNLPASSITVHNHCRSDFKMGSIHKVQQLYSSSRHGREASSSFWIESLLPPP